MTSVEVQGAWSGVGSSMVSVLFSDTVRPAASKNCHDDGHHLGKAFRRLRHNCCVIGAQHAPNCPPYTCLNMQTLMLDIESEVSIYGNFELTICRIITYIRVIQYYQTRLALRPLSTACHTAILVAGTPRHLFRSWRCVTSYCTECTTT